MSDLSARSSNENATMRFLEENLSSDIFRKAAEGSVKERQNISLGDGFDLMMRRCLIKGEKLGAPDRG